MYKETIMERKDNPFLDNGSGEDPSSPDKQALQDDENDIASGNISSSMSKDEWNAILKGVDDDDEIAEKQTRRKKIKKVGNILMGAALVVIVIVIMVFIIQYMMTITGTDRNQNGKPQQTTSQQTTSQNYNSAYTDSNGGKNPASASNVSYATSSTDSTVSVDHRKITIKGQKTTTVVDLSPLQNDISAQPCELKAEASSCYVGLSQYTDKDVHIFAFRDASKTSLLLTSSSIKKHTIQGTVLSYSQKVSVDGKEKNALVLINTDQTGIMLVSDASLSTLESGILVGSSSNK